MQKFFATFGQAHPFKKKVICITAHDAEDARLTMHELFGKNWAFLYEFYHPDNGFLKQHEDFGYQVLACIGVTRRDGGGFYIDEIDQINFAV